MSTTAYDDQFVPEPKVPNPMPVFHHAVIPDALLEISRKLHSQDGRITSHPIFQVRKHIQIHGVLADCAESWVWLDEEVCLVTDQTLINTLDKHVEEHGFDFEYEVMDKENETSYSRSYYRTKEVTVDGATFFTQDAADAYIKANQKRHDEKLYVFVESGWRNPEWQQVRDFLLSLTLPVTTKE